MFEHDMTEHIQLLHADTTSDNKTTVISNVWNVQPSIQWLEFLESISIKAM